MTEITPERAAPRPVAVAAASGASQPGRAPLPTAIDRADCGPEAPLSLYPTCRPLPPDRSRAASPRDTAARHDARAADDAARNALIENENRRILIRAQPNLARPGERDRLDRERLRLEQDLRGGSSRLASPTMPGRGRYGL